MVSIVLYGSWARDRANPESDIDILIVAKRLSKSRSKRIEEFIDNVERGLDEISHYISPLIKTPEEVSTKNPLFLDMVYDAKVLYDRECFFEKTMKDLRQRLEQTGAKRVFKGNRWYWRLNHDICKSFGSVHLK